MSRHKQRRVDFKVSLLLPEGAKAADARDYIEDATVSWKGSLFPGQYDSERDAHIPGDPMFDLDSDSIRVSRLLTRKIETKRKD